MKKPELLKVNGVFIKKDGEWVDFEKLPLEERRDYINARNIDYIQSRAAREGYKITSIEPIYKQHTD